MHYNTKKLIVELLARELSRANRLPTLMYHEEIKVARRDFIEWANKNNF
mgnify:CR=1 FL=1